MPDGVYHLMTLLCALVVPLPIGTNLGLLHLLWMLVSGRLLRSRGALFPGLAEAGLTDGEVRRAWAALGQGAWRIDDLLARWQTHVQAEGHWQAHDHGGYQPVAVDVTGFWRPRLQDCPTTHYHGPAGRALPAIPIGIIARVGAVAGQRRGLPLGLVRADPADPRPSTHQQRLLQVAVARSAPTDVLVIDSGFTVAHLQAAGAQRYVVRLAKNVTARRASPPPYQGRGRRPTRGLLVRPVPRPGRGRFLPGTPPDETVTWTEGTTTIRAEVWTDLVLPEAGEGSPTVRIVAIHDPRYAAPLLLATPLALAPPVVRDLYADRWPVEQIPLAAKQMLGGARQFVHEPETCQRLPELVLLAGAIVSYVAATGPAVPTGFWDRQPQPTPGRLRRVLERCSFPRTFPLPGRLREKDSVTAHLPTGWWGQRRPAAATEAPAALPRSPDPVVQAA
jgi:hypothetical protein